MIQNHLKTGKYRIDIPSIISLISCNYPKLQNVGIKILSILSDPNIADFQNYDLQFENHIKFLLELSLSNRKPYEFRNSALKAISNLCLKDSLRPIIVYNHGIDALIFHVRNEENLEGQRSAAKGLLNLSINSSKKKIYYNQ